MPTKNLANALTNEMWKSVDYKATERKCPVIIFGQELVQRPEMGSMNMGRDPFDTTFIQQSTGSGFFQPPSKHETQTRNH